MPHDGPSCSRVTNSTSTPNCWLIVAAGVRSKLSTMSGAIDRATDSPSRSASFIEEVLEASAHVCCVRCGTCSDRFAKSIGERESSFSFAFSEPLGTFA